MVNLMFHPFFEYKITDVTNYIGLVLVITYVLDLLSLIADHHTIVPMMIRVITHLRF